MKRVILALVSLLILPNFLQAQENYKTISKEDSARYYFGQDKYEVVHVNEPTKKRKPKNIIFLIGDGMGLAQIYSGMVANRGELNLNNFKTIGFSNNYSSDNFITDSGAAGTALATGVKTYNGAIGMGPDRKSVVNIREKFEGMGKATGVISTSSITHATPASFVSHQISREWYEAIAADFLKTNVDVFIGGGYKHFAQRRDKRNLVQELKDKGYQFASTIDSASMVKSGKLAALLAPEHLPKIKEGRGNMLSLATTTALDILNNDKDGFFIMIEGSQIDWGGHQNDVPYIVTEVLDFDQAIGEALKFAAKDKETLVVVTADHETGGLGVVGGNFEEGNFVGRFTSGDHTGIMIPVFAFGPGAEEFSGFYENTDIPLKMLKLIGK